MAVVRPAWTGYHRACVRVLILFALTGCTSLLGISDPTPAAPGDGGPDSHIDSNIDAPPPCAPAVTLKPEVTSDVGVTGTGFAIGRFDNGANVDIAIATGTNVVIFHGDAAGAFGADAMSSTIPTAATDLVVADFDVDADDDLAMWTKGGTSVIVRRLDRTVDPPVGAEQPLTGPFTSVQNVVDTLIDGAGVPDLLVYDSAAGSRAYTALLGIPGTFSRSMTLVGTGADELVLAAQLDGAMRDDALFVNGQTVKVAASTGTNFSNPVNVATGAASKGVAVGKFDGDNLLDIVVSTTMGLVLYRQQAGGTFMMHGMISPVQAAAPMLVGDVNGDGRDDILVANAAILQCAPATAGGPGVFTQVEALSAAAPSKLVDVTGDGLPDLVRLDGTSVKVRAR